MEIFTETIGADTYGRSINHHIGHPVGLVATGACVIQVFNATSRTWQNAETVATPFVGIFYPPCDKFRILDTSGTDNPVTLSI